MNIRKILITLTICLTLNSCGMFVSSTIDATSSALISIVKIPFKIIGAIIPDDDDKEEDNKTDKGDKE